MRTSTAILTEGQLAAGLAGLPRWSVQNGKLAREWVFADFAQAMKFVNWVARTAESVNHHPDMDIRYTQVRLSLISYDVGGLTARDLCLARRLGEYPSP